MTIVEVLFLTLIRAQLAAAAAILLVMALRPLARRLVGAGLTYRLWMLAPVAAMVSLFPTLADCLEPVTVAADPSGFGAWRAPAGLLLTLWLAGVAMSMTMLALAELRFRRLAEVGLAGPAVMGLGWPRMVVPADYRQRFTETERLHIGRHERAHMDRRDPQARFFIAAMQVLGWCNPLVHFAASRARLDQEIACDATVMEHRPEGRRGYAETLLKAHAETPGSRFACAWAPAGRRDLELRLLTLARPAVPLARYMAGATALLVLVTATAVGVWATGPGVGSDARTVSTAFASGAPAR